MMNAKDPNWHYKLEVEAIKAEINEYNGYHKKHIFDDDTTIAENYEEMIEGLKNKIKEIESLWKK